MKFKYNKLLLLINVEKSMMQIYHRKKIKLINKKKSNLFRLNDLYYFFNSFIYINYYIISFSNKLSSFFFLFNIFNKYISVKETKTYFLNANINSIIKKTYKNFYTLLKYWRLKLMWPSILYLKQLYARATGMKLYFHYKRSIRSWFMGINRKEPKIININNFLIYFSQIFGSIKYLTKVYIKKISNFVLNNIININIYNKLYVSKNNLYLYLMLLKKKKKQYFKKKKIIFLKIFNKIINQYIKNITKIYLYYINTFNYLNNSYYNFSFSLKRKKKKKQNKIKKYKSFNFMFLLNNLIYQFMHFIFIYWINTFIKLLLNINESMFIPLKVIQNYAFINNIYNTYYKKRRNKINLKLNYLNYYKPSKFLLYWNYNKKIKQDAS